MAKCRIRDHKLTTKDSYCRNCGFPNKKAVSPYYERLQLAQQDRYAAIYSDFQDSTDQLQKVADQISTLEVTIGELKEDERKMRKTIALNEEYIAQYEQETEAVEQLLDTLEYYMSFQRRQEGLLQGYEHNPKDRRRITYSTRKDKIRVELDQITEVPSVLLILNTEKTNRMIGPNAVFLRLDDLWKRHTEDKNVFIARVPDMEVLKGRMWYGHLSTQHNLPDQQIPILGDEFEMQF